MLHVLYRIDYALRFWLYGSNLYLIGYAFFVRCVKNMVSSTTQHTNNRTRIGACRVPTIPSQKAGKWMAAGRTHRRLPSPNHSKAGNGWLPGAVYIWVMRPL